MLQRLLAERFSLAVHRKTTEQDVYVLEVAPGGVKFAEAPEIAAGAPSEAKVEPGVTLRGRTKITRKDGYRLIETETIADLAEFIRPSLGAMVLDDTGLAGSYAISMQLMDLTPPVGNNSMADLIFPAVERLGLRLVREKKPVQMIVIDHVEKLPTEN